MQMAREDVESFGRCAAGVWRWGIGVCNSCWEVGDWGVQQVLRGGGCGLL